MRRVLLAASAVALGGALLFSPVSQQSAQAQMLGALKASAANGGNLITLVGRGGGRGGISRGGGSRGAHIARGGGGRAVHAYRGGRYAGNIGRYHGGNRYYANRYRGNYHGKYNGKYYGNRYYGYRRPWIGVGVATGAYRYGSTNCDSLFRYNFRRWLAVCQ